MGITNMKQLKFLVFLCVLSFTVSCGQQKRYIQYKVKEGETMSIIAKKLKMKMQALKRLNPHVSNEPKANSFIVVPDNNLVRYQNSDKSKQIEKETDSLAKKELAEQIIKDSIAAVNNQFITHEIKNGDTFFSLSQKYNVATDSLFALNPGLKKGLKLGSTIRIKRLTLTDNLEDVFYYNDYIDPSVDLKVALLLPFNAENYQANTLTAKEIFTGNARLLNIATDFFLGAEIAIDSLRKQGVNVNVNVYDTGDPRNNKVGSVIASNALNDNDAIIGPLFSSQAQTVAASVTKPVVYPVYSRSQSNFAYSNIIKTATEKNVFREELEQYILSTFTSGNVIIVSDGKGASMQDANLIKSALSVSDSISSINILYQEEGFIDKEKFTNIMQPNTENWIVLATDDNVTIVSTVNSMISLPEETTAKLLAYNLTAAYDNLDNKKLAKLKFVYVTDEFVDEEAIGVQSFEAMYRKKNKTMPSFYATKGFDITYDIIIRLASGK
jgi:LysM repeat protein